MSEDEIDKLAQAIADKIELNLRRNGHWPGQTDPQWTSNPQWWQPGGSPTCEVSA